MQPSWGLAFPGGPTWDPAYQNRFRLCVLRVLCARKLRGLALLGIGRD